MEKNAREGTRGTAHPTQLNTLGALREFNKVLRVEYGGERLPPDCLLVLAVIRTESEKQGFCSRSVIQDQIGKRSKNGIFVLILERHALVIRNSRNRYTNTINGEILLNSVILDLTRILENKPTKRKRVIDPSQRPRQKPPIETFEQLVSETLNKKGLNKRVKYALLRTLGMKKDEAQQALKIITPLKHTERIKPVLKNILIDLINNTEAENTKG